MGLFSNIFGKSKPNSNPPSEQSSNENDVNPQTQHADIYVCPNCGHKSNGPGNCPNCGIPLRNKGERIIKDEPGTPPHSDDNNGEPQNQTIPKPQVPPQTPEPPQPAPKSPQMPPQTPEPPKPQPGPQSEPTPAPQPPKPPQPEFPAPEEPKMPGSNNPEPPGTPYPPETEEKEEPKNI
jgi:predicted RNA-binding Zn-ribbon protein involved in translation (DUF1610 family)